MNLDPFAYPRPHRRPPKESHCGENKNEHDRFVFSGITLCEDKRKLLADLSESRRRTPRFLALLYLDSREHSYLSFHQHTFSLLL